MKKISLIACLLMNAALLAQEPQGGFVPVKEVPASEQLPSAPLVLIAYAFVWAAFLAYTWTMWRKLGKVEQEITTLSAQLSKPRATRTDGARP
jgi:CcmD family protein